MRSSQVVAIFAVALSLASCAHVPNAQHLETSCHSSPEANRQIVLAFYDQALIKRKVREAFETYVREDFVDHKTSLTASTRAAAITYLEGLIKEVPNPSWEVLRTAAEGDLVFMHNRFIPEPNAPAFAIANISPQAVQDRRALGRHRRTRQRPTQSGLTILSGLWCSARMCEIAGKTLFSTRPSDVRCSSDERSFS